MVRGLRVQQEKDFHLYEHNLVFWNSNKNDAVCYKIINNIATPFANRQEVGQWCINNNCYNAAKKALSGFYASGGSTPIAIGYFSNATTFMNSVNGGFASTTYGNEYFEDNVRII
jgi:hypothetical protein